MSQNNFNGNNRSSFGMDENIAGLLCYVLHFITGIVFFFSEKQSRFVKFHAMQSILVFLPLNIILKILGYIPFLGGLMAGLLGLFEFVLWIVLMVKAYNREWFKLPIVGDIAERQANS